jgi:hypothetical protein
MALDRTLSTLELLKPFAKAIPFAGENLQGIIEIVTQGYTYAKVRGLD